MAGHSQFKNIMHRKGRQDAVRSKLFGKLAREITVAAKLGLPDPAMNPRLRAAIIAARAENMPKDNIERAIKKAPGGDAENYEEIRYEGYGPGGVAVIVEALTDNRNRTAGEVRATFTKSGGNLAETGAVSFMFDHVGVVEFDAKVGERRRHAGGRDRGRRRRRGVERERPRDLHHARIRSRDVAKALEAKFGEPRKAALVWKPQNTIAVDDEQGEKLLKLIDDAQRARRRAERLRQFRSVGRAGAEDERVTLRCSAAQLRLEYRQADQRRRGDDHDRPRGGRAAPRRRGTTVGAGRQSRRGRERRATSPERDRCRR